MPGVCSDEFQAQRTFRCSSNFSLFFLIFPFQTAHADLRNEYCSVLRFGRAFRVELYRMTKDSSGKTETLDISSNSQLEIELPRLISSAGHDDQTTTMKKMGTLPDYMATRNLALQERVLVETAGAEDSDRQTNSEKDEEENESGDSDWGHSDKDDATDSEGDFEPPTIFEDAIYDQRPAYLIGAG